MSNFDNLNETRYDQLIMTLNVSLTPHLEQFIRDTLNSGRYQSASEVVRTALRLLEERERRRQTALDWLRIEIQKGLNSGPGTPLDMNEVKRLARKRLFRDDGTPS